ncbi:MAG: hypothetical protein AAFY02_13575 [Pseudomonadota bacterium]
MGATAAGLSTVWAALVTLLALLLVLGLVWLVAWRLARAPKEPPPPPRDPIVDQVVGKLRRHPLAALGLGLGAGLLVSRSRGGESLLRTLALILQESYRRPPQ